MQGHLNFHLSSTSLILINRMDNLDAAEILCNKVNSSMIAKVTLREMFYHLRLKDGSPLFLQLTQRPSGEVDAVIPNTLEAELKAEKINQQVAAWCLNYWTKSNPGGAAFYQKLANHAFNQALLCEVSKCTWETPSRMVTSPNAQSNIVVIVEFESQDWVQDILKTNSAGQQDNKKAYVDPNIVFLFQYDFSVGTIHGANGTRSPVAPSSEKTAPTGPAAAGAPCNQNAMIEILDNNVEDDVSMLTTKTQDELVTLLVKTRRQIHASTGSRVDSGSGIPPGRGPVAMLSPSNVSCQQTAPTDSAASGISGAVVNGEASNGPSGK
jgi:hypothetical protein